ncbi:hypothetical protein [Myxococcus sp. AM010]|uniref:hypothetical protein n=1 Tax=Myxococcus sp. AM010 TaxID=2745138 RepID=UPI0015963DC8|nr:hypothetical protein [Myxococcus sp. AM010]NVJ17766.1 hypothetical protein [Myxococcus sp. AM010]
MLSRRLYAASAITLALFGLLRCTVAQVRARRRAGHQPPEDDGDAAGRARAAAPSPAPLGAGPTVHRPRRHHHQRGGLQAANLRHTRNFNFLWEELPLRYDTDFQRAEAIIVATVREATAGIIDEGRHELANMRERYLIHADELEPRAYLWLTDNWVELRVREVKDGISSAAWCAPAWRALSWRPTRWRWCACPGWDSALPGGPQRRRRRPLH